MSLEKQIIYILIQELYENELFDIKELQEKYSLTAKQKIALQKIYNEIYE